MRHINDAAWQEYAHGATPYEYAQGIVAGEIAMRERVIFTRYRTPEAYPSYPEDTSIETLTARVVRSLIEAGWTPPNVSPDDFETDPDDVPWS